LEPSGVGPRPGVAFHLTLRGFRFGAPHVYQNPGPLQRILQLADQWYTLPQTQNVRTF
jgi:hypothetical protein